MPESEIIRAVLIEDNPDDQELMMRQLKKSGISEHVKFISDGKEALEFLSKLPPSKPFCDLIAIFLDLKLPGMHGIKLLQEIRVTPRVKDTPVIIITGSIDPKDFEACQALNVTAFIPKPITFESFSKAIMSIKPI